LNQPVLLINLIAIFYNFGCGFA